MRPVNSSFLSWALTEKVRAGIEGGCTACSSRRVVIVLARMPLTRHAGRFLGLGVLGRGGGAVLRSDLATMLRSVSLGAPGSSLDTCSKRVMACWICFLAVGAGFAFLGTLGWAADVAAAA